MKTFSTPTSRAGYKVRLFLTQIGLPDKVVQSSWKSNRLVFIPFLKSVNKPYKQMSPNYKGINTADLINCYSILEDSEIWKQFRFWCKENKGVIVENHLKPNQV
jgi:hypothetical protein